MGLIDRILTSIPDSGWRQTAHERRSADRHDAGAGRVRPPRGRGAAPAFDACDEPPASAGDGVDGGQPGAVRRRPVWHERFMPGDEYAGSDDADASAPDANGGAAPCLDEAPSFEPAPAPAAAQETARRAAARESAGVPAEETRAAPPPPAESLPQDPPRLFPLGDGLAADGDGYLTDSEGRYLKGLPPGTAAGERPRAAPSFICIDTYALPARATREIRYLANLPPRPMTTAADPARPGSEMLDVDVFSRNPIANGFGVVMAEEARHFMAQSLSGGSIVLYDQGGKSTAIRLRWAKITSATPGGGVDRWNLFYLVSSDAVGRESAWRNAGIDYAFTPSGRLEAPLPRVTLANVVIDGARLGDITLVHGRDGVTQFDSRLDLVKVREMTQDGHLAGEFTGVELSDEGVVSARYSNGRVLPLAENVFTCGDVPQSADDLAFAGGSGVAEEMEPMGVVYEEAA